MATQSSAILVAPGSALYALLKNRIGDNIVVTTAAGEVSGQLTDFSQSYLIVSGTGGTRYVLIGSVSFFSFVEPV
ncbi:DUF2642 domain-containing protein [Paenibacillus sp. NPDC058071]|uniref:DUF2642 domain-containing protein n=1 Tax=Paenibacillus sp. NPDC058071 TaxID=3346326 RepID=UPI0036DA0BB3